MKKVIWMSVVAIIIVIIIIVSITRTTGINTIKIGGLYPLTGGLASYGEPAQRSALLAVEDINTAGGIDGKKLELVSGDHKCDPKAMTAVFERLVSIDGVHIFNSVACTGTVVAIAPNFEAKDVVMLSSTISGTKLTGISPAFFRNWASDAQEAKLLADQVIQKGYKNVAVIYEETDYAKGLKLAMEDYLKGSGVKMTGESFASGAGDVRTQLTKLQALKPDLLFVSVQTVPSGELVLTQMEQLRFKPAAMFVNDNILKAASLLKGHTALLEGAVGGDYVFNGSDQLKNLLAKYKAKYGQDCPQINICAAQYDAIQLLAKAIKEKGNNAQSVKEFLSQAKYEGVSGSISFDAKNDRSGAEYSLFEIRSGEAKLLGK